MLMLWEDLLPGDIVALTDEVKEFYKDWCDKDLMIKEILIHSAYITIDFGRDHFHINFDGSSYGWMYNVSKVFNIVSLKEDD